MAKQLASDELWMTLRRTVRRRLAGAPEICIDLRDSEHANPSLTAA